MSNGASAGRGAIGRLLLLLLLALGLMHLLAHAGSADTGHGSETPAHVHAQQQAQAVRGASAPLVLAASVEEEHHGFGEAAEVGLCATVLGCCALLAAGRRGVRGRAVALRDSLVRRLRAHHSGIRRCLPPARAGTLTQLAILRI
ncbi:hypothetical protein Stsp02_31570 [Streptomyces sp. NBRC 14336]|uniref:hypothetical protein n=1 Tax=Streptomyces TaxID=1883 RepID=UPI0024A5C6C3|nr:hypothetical protein [Streptomyces sp. NBRC 14336]GLW47495.1 hypothetical protein Stsp02_31570 [Streptomyces sp. NBRC 14336]